ncbi:MAG: MBL fold metallo-hydrolase, partial [Deltaproteobacteria bacterium]|nr:MBL fold metallo-hydrolase [Deltaproteobacteria bacterium]
FAVRGTYGGNTPCVQIDGIEELVLCDAGTGLRDFGNAFLHSPRAAQPAVFHLFLSHLHWDHIQGFPFFVPAYRPGNEIHIYSGHDEAERAFTTQQAPPSFPIPFAALGATIRFHRLDPAEVRRIAGFDVRLMPLNHPGTSFGYAFERDGKKVVYASDAEHGPEAQTEAYPFVDFCKGADLLIFDAQYSLADALGPKETWGHSSNVLGVELAVRADVKRLCLFHSEPTREDEAMDLFLTETREYLKLHAPEAPLSVELAYDGLRIDL